MTIDILGMWMKQACKGGTALNGSYSTYISSCISHLRMGPINNHQQKIRRKKTWRKPQEIDRNLQTWTVPVTIWKYLNRLSATRKGLNVSFYMSTNPCNILKYQAHIITYQPFFQTLVISCNHFYFFMFLSISCKTHIFEHKKTPPFIQFEFVTSPMSHSIHASYQGRKFPTFPTPSNWSGKLLGRCRCNVPPLGGAWVFLCAARWSMIQSSSWLSLCHCQPCDMA